MRRIAITGVGLVSALGCSSEENWTAALAGRSGVRREIVGASPHGPGGLELPIAKAPEGLDSILDARVAQPVAAGLDPFARLALAAAREAIEQAALTGAPALVERTAVVLGHGHGGLQALEAGYERFFGLKSPRIHPTTVPRTMVSAAATAISMSLGVKGPVFAVSSACASSAHAIVCGARMIATGDVELALVGGSEAVCTAGWVRGWEALRAMSQTGCRPFSADRDGMVLGEGAAVFVLEDLNRAVARGAEVVGELIGWGQSSDATEITQPSVAGQARAIRAAVERAQLPPDGEMLISAHGTGTPLNDPAETGSLVEALGERARGMPVIATKAAHGHLIGASAALQAALGLRSLAEGVAPPIVGFGSRDPACDLDLVTGQARRISSRFLLQNAFAFGGLNVALVFAGPEASKDLRS